MCNHGRCMNIPGSFECQCDRGFAYDINVHQCIGMTCIFIFVLIFINFKCVWLCRSVFQDNSSENSYCFCCECLYCCTVQVIDIVCQNELPSFTVHYFISALNRALLQCLLHLHISTKIVYGLNFSPQQPAWLWHVVRISTRVPSALGNPLSVCTVLSFDKDSSLLGYDTL
jgi:hypothetical protein